jgi:hypothetical protein
MYSILWKRQMLIFFPMTDFYLCCQKSNRRLELNDAGFFFICWYKRRWCGGHLFFAKYVKKKYEKNYSTSQNLLQQMFCNKTKSIHFFSTRWVGGCMVFNATFNNIPVISWLSVLLVEETGGPVIFSFPMT